MGVRIDFLEGVEAVLEGCLGGGEVACVEFVAHDFEGLVHDSDGVHLFLVLVEEQVEFTCFVGPDKGYLPFFLVDGAGLDVAVAETEGDGLVLDAGLGVEDAEADEGKLVEARVGFAEFEFEAAGAGLGEGIAIELAVFEVLVVGDLQDEVFGHWVKQGLELAGEHFFHVSTVCDVLDKATPCGGKLFEEGDIVICAYTHGGTLYAFGGIGFLSVEGLFHGLGPITVGKEDEAVGEVGAEVEHDLLVPSFEALGDVGAAICFNAFDGIYEEGTVIAHGTGRDDDKVFVVEDDDRGDVCWAEFANEVLEGFFEAVDALGSCHGSTFVDDKADVHGFAFGLGRGLSSEGEVEDGIFTVGADGAAPLALDADGLARFRGWVLFGEEIFEGLYDEVFWLRDIAVGVLVFFEWVVGERLVAVTDASAPRQVDDVEVIGKAAMDHVLLAFGEEETCLAEVVGRGFVHLFVTQDFEEDGFATPYAVGTSFEGDGGEDTSGGAFLVGREVLGGGVPDSLFVDEGGFVGEGAAHAVAGGVGEVGVAEGIDAIDVDVVFLAERDAEGGDACGVGGGGEGFAQRIAGDGNGEVGEGLVIGFLDLDLDDAIARGGGGIGLEFLGFGGETQTATVDGRTGFPLVAVVVVGNDLGHAEVFGGDDFDLPEVVVFDVLDVDLPVSAGAKVLFDNTLRIGLDFDALAGLGLDELNLCVSHGTTLVVFDGEVEVDLALGSGLGGLGQDGAHHEDEEGEGGEELSWFHSGKPIGNLEV